MFSATGSLLPGSLERPDILTLTKIGSGIRAVQGIPCKLNKLGYIPVVSTFTGVGRALLGIIHTIVHLVSAIFDRQNQAQHLKEAALGAKNIGRGIVEAVPIVGNLTMLITDVIRMKKFENLEKERQKSSSTNDEQVVILSAYGVEIGKKPRDEITQAIKALNREPTRADMNNIMNMIAAPNRVVFA